MAYRCDWFFLAAMLAAIYYWWSTSIHLRFEYTSQRNHIPAELRLAVDDYGNYQDDIIDAQRIIGSSPSFTCRQTENEANIVEFFSFYQGTEDQGEWIYRYGVFCENNYYIIDSNSASGTIMAGPFKL